VLTLMDVMEPQALMNPPNATNPDDLPLRAGAGDPTHPIAEALSNALELTGRIEAHSCHAIRMFA
jgi:hypothetical protein